MFAVSVVIMKIPSRKIMEGLIVSKFLYSKAEKESYQKGIASKLSILTLHDSVEMYLYMASLHNKHNSSKRNFMRFWKDFPNLSHKNEMDSFNTVRNKFKHEGIEPSSKSVIDSINDVLDFFKTDTKYLFDIEYSEITLVSLIKYSEIKKIMSESEEYLMKGNYDSSVENSALAFYRILYIHDNWIKEKFANKRSRSNNIYSMRRVRGNFAVPDMGERMEKAKEEELLMIQS